MKRGAIAVTTTDEDRLERDRRARGLATELNAIYRNPDADGELSDDQEALIRVLARQLAEHVLSTPDGVEQYCPQCEIKRMMTRTGEFVACGVCGWDSHTCAVCADPRGGRVTWECASEVAGAADCRGTTVKEICGSK